MSTTDPNPAPKAMAPEKLRALCATAAGRGMVAGHLATLREARAEYVDRGHGHVEGIRAELAKAEASIADHLKTVDSHIAACEAALAAAGVRAA